MSWIFVFYRALYQNRETFANKAIYLKCLKAAIDLVCPQWLFSCEGDVASFQEVIRQKYFIMIT